MPSWILVPCLVSLRDEFNALAPNRSKASDGSIGDQKHASSSSDHNPDETGTTPYEDSDSINEVHAIDVDKDLNKPGWSMQKAVDIIVTRHRSGIDTRLRNVIYNRVIWSASWGWVGREYTGENAHTEHAHFSSQYTSAAESNTDSWGLIPINVEGVMLISFGDSGEEVKYWQRMHNWVCILPEHETLPLIVADGDYGPSTRAAFSAFAKASGGSSSYVANTLDSWTAIRYHRDFIKTQLPVA